MFELAVALSFLVSAALGLYLLTVFIANSFLSSTVGGPTELKAVDLLRAKVEQVQSSLYRHFSSTHAIMALQQGFQLVYMLLDLVPIGLSMVSMVVINRKAYMLAGVLFATGWWLMYNTEVALTAIESFYKCVLSPFLNTYGFVFLEFINVFYAAIVPVYNLIIVVIRQIIVGSFLILTKCTTSTLTVVNFVSSLVLIFTTSITEILRFTGLSNGVNGSNNPIVNTFHWNAVVKPIRLLLQYIPESLACVCSGNSGWLAYIYRWLFFPLFTDHLDYIVEHALNHFILWGQTLIQALPPFLSYPEFSFYHLVSLSLEVGTLLDRWLFLLFQLIMQLFKISGYSVIIEPTEVFIFSSAGRLLAAVFVFLESLVSMVQHLLLPFAEEPLTNQKYMVAVFSLKKAWSYLDQSMVALFNTLNFLTTTLLKIFVLITAMGSNGCKTFPGSCHAYLEGSCAVYCQSKNTIVFKNIPLQCNYDVNSYGKYLHNLDAIEELDSKVFEALDSFDDGFVRVADTRACLLEWDESFTYKRGDMVSFNAKGYVCTSSRCFYTTLQPNTPTSSCNNFGVTCWESIPYSEDALQECPKILNSTDTATLDECQQWCNETKACKGFEFFDREKYSSERQSVTRKCGTDPSRADYMKCDFPQCKLYEENMDNTKLYLTKTRRPTTTTRTPLGLAFVYGEEGVPIRNLTYPVFCTYKEEESVFCLSPVDNVALDYVDQFEEFSGYNDPYYTFGYKTDSFTTEQEVFLPLQRELLSVAVLKNKYSRYTFTFSRRNPLNETEVIGTALEGKEVPESKFKLGVVRDTYRELITPEDSFNFNAFVSCSGLSFSRVVSNAILVFYEFFNELLWNIVSGNAVEGTQVESSLFQDVGEDFFLARVASLLYKFDGPWYSRDSEPPCSPQLPLTSERLSMQSYKNDYYDPYCGNVNMQFHVYANWDKMAFFATSILEKNTFGKLAFNLLRMAPEFYRLGTRMFLDMQTFRVLEKLSLKPLGCGYQYGNQTGDCTPIAKNMPPCPLGFPSADCQCRFDDPSLRFDTECACVWLISEKIDSDLEAQTNVAVSHWCQSNFFEFTLIYVSRATDALKRIIDSLQVGANTFPVSPDLCLVDETNRYQRGGKKYVLFEESIVDRVFGGVIKRNFDTNEQFTCGVTAHHDVACSVSATVERIVGFVLEIVRKLWKNAGSFLAGEPDAIDIDLTSEICNIQQLEASLASSITEVAPGFSSQSLSTRKGITSLIYSFMDIIGVVFSEMHLALLFIRSFLSGDSSILEGGAMGTDETQNMVATSDLSVIFYASLTKFVVVLFSFVRQLFLSLSRIGSPSLFLNLVKITDFLEQMVTSGIIPILSSTAYLAIRFLGMIFTPHLIKPNDVLEIVTQFLDLLGQVVTLMLTQAMTVLSMVLRLMGVFGQMIGSLLKIVCAVQGVLSDLTFGAWEKMSCDALPSLRRRTLAEKEITQLVYEEWDWDGDSFCDQFITLHKDWSVDQLRPLEKLRFKECVEWRALNEQIINATGFKLPKDLVYNWKTPIRLFGSGLQAGLIYLRWATTDNRNIGVLKQQLEVNGLPADEILHGIHTVKKAVGRTVTRENFNSLMMAVFNEHDPNFEDKHSNSSTRKVYKVYNALSSGVGGIYDIISSDEFNRGIESMKHFHIPSPAIGNLTFSMPSKEQIFSQKALAVTTQVKNMHHTFGRVYTSLECQQSEEENIFCFECALFDNFVYSSFGVVERVGDFYSRDYVQDFLIPFNNSWENAASSSQKYNRAYKTARRQEEEQYGGDTTTADEWLDYAAGLLLHQNRTVDELFNAVSYWFQGNYTGEVPSNATLLLPGDFQSTLEYPFEADCTTASFLWKPKLRSPFYGFLPGLIALALFEVFLFFVADVPFYLKVSVYLGISILAPLAYAVVVYQYNVFCIPQVPLYLLRDLLDYFEETLFVSCSCKWFPFLSKECTQQTCYSCDASDTPTYYSCYKQASGMENLGLFWHPLFLVRAFSPETLAFFGTLSLFPFTFLKDVEGLNVLLEQAINQAPVLGLDWDCFYFTIFVPIAEVFLVVLLFMTISPILRWSLEVIRHAILFVFHLFISLLYLAYAVSRS